MWHNLSTLTNTSWESNSRGDREKRVEKVFEEIIIGNFSNLMKNTNLHIQEAQPTPTRIV